jgi:hypothetical protein
MVPVEYSAILSKNRFITMTYLLLIEQAIRVSGYRKI